MYQLSNETIRQMVGSVAYISSTLLFETMASDLT